MPLALADTAASGIPVATDRDRVYQVIRHLDDVWDAKEHLVLGEDTYYVVEFKDFSDMGLDIKQTVSSATAHLPFVFDVQFFWDIADPVSHSAVLHTVNSPSVLRVRVLVAKTGCVHPPADCTEDLMTKFKDKVAVKDFLKGFLDERDPFNQEAWERIQGHIYNIVQMSYRRKEHLPWSFFNFSRYPTHKMFGFHIMNMDTTKYAFLRALSAVAGVCHLMVGTRNNEIEVRLDGRDPIPWRSLPGSVSSSVTAVSSRKRTSDEAVTEIEAVSDPAWDRHQKRARPHYSFQ